jgi:hypothetical protein
MHGIELRRHACVKYALVHALGNAGPIVYDRDRPDASLASRGYKQAHGACITGIAKKLNDGIFHASYVVLRLTPLGFGHPQSHEAASQRLLYTQTVPAPKGGDEVYKRGI